MRNRWWMIAIGDGGGLSWRSIFLAEEIRIDAVFCSIEFLPHLLHRRYRRVQQQKNNPLMDAAFISDTLANTFY